MAFFIGHKGYYLQCYSCGWYSFFNIITTAKTYVLQGVTD